MRIRSRASDKRRSIALRFGVGLCCAVGFLVAFDAPASAATGYSTLLTRAPYLTDLVGQHVAINFATVPSSSTATVLWGAATGGGCSPTTQVTTTKRSITVGTVVESQWTAQLDLPASGQYCYRPFLGTTDLLGGAATPTFTTQEPVGSTHPFTFDVMGDWGQVDANGQNPQQAALMSQISSSGARFLVTVGDNGYNTGNQLNYGDLNQVGANTSAIFGPSFWTVPGSHIPIFTAAGNHGLSGTSHTDITTWTQNQAVTSSGGRYQNDVYCCVNNTSSANYGSEWYAFNAGNARFYVLDAAWGDTNAGTGTTYSDDAAAHFSPGTPEYTWLVNDLRTHRAQLKFAFFHFPLYSDQTSQPSDTFLDGPQNLEGLLASNGVQMVFNGHAHVYERNLPSAPGMPVSYTTGGGGGTPEPIGSPCTSKDAYGFGWSPTKLKGYACGAAKPPKSPDEFFHFLRVTVSGSTVTVAPTNSLGATFDVQTYTTNPPPATYLDQTPPAMSNSTTATFAFHASSPTATFACSLDHVPATPCTSPLTTTALADGTHAFSVAAADGGQVDPQPATSTWTVDTIAPSVPTDVRATAPSSVEVDLSWTASQDTNGISGYRLFRNGAAYQQLPATTSFQDAVSPNTSYSYSVAAVDSAGNVSSDSSPISITTPAQLSPVFADGFESGSLSAWSSHGGLVVESTTVRTGTHAALASSGTAANYAKRTLPSTYADGYTRTAFDLVSPSGQVNLLRVRSSDGTSIGYVYVSAAGMLGFHNDTLGTSTVSTVNLTNNSWHMLEMHVRADSTVGTPTGAVQIWLDGTLVAGMSNSAIDIGAAPIGQMQIGDAQVGKAVGVAFDDAAFGTTRLGTA